MKRELIIDNGKVRRCDKNIANSNIFTYHIYFSKWHEFMFPIRPPEHIFQVLLQLICFLLQITMLGFIVSLFYSSSEIKRAKYNVNRENKYRRK